MDIDINKTIKENAIVLNKHPETVGKYLRKHGIKVKEGRGKIPSLLFNPFNIDSNQGSYWLGYFIGDGTFEHKNMKISTKDIDIVNKFYAYTNLKNKVTIQTYIIKQNQLETIYVFGFGNEKILNYLYSLGLCQQKTYKMVLNFEFNWHIIRGLFDSDGSFSNNRFKITSSNIKLIEKLDSFFQLNQFETFICKKGKAFDIYLKWGKANSKSKVIIKSQKQRLFTLLYKDADFYLDRKYKQIATFISDNN